MKIWRIVVAVVCLLLSTISTGVTAGAAAAIPGHAPELRVLFVGNSLTYTNNMPGLFAAWANAAAPRSPTAVDMFVRGGATLDSAASDARLAAVIEKGGYNVIVLQERGGIASCAATAEDRAVASCDKVIDGAQKLARLARGVHARLYYLGTYEPDAESSQQLLRGERWISARLPAQYVEISESWRALRSKYPDYGWLYTDGMHPGIALSSLMAIRLERAIYGRATPATELPMELQRYTPSAGFDGLVRYSRLSQASGQPSVVVSRAQIEAIMREPVR